jgi:hypothetical protein
MFLQKSLSMTGLLLALAACGQAPTTKTSDLKTEVSPSSDGPYQRVASNVTRHPILTMTFTKWGDVIMVDAGVARSAEGQCKFVAPILTDASTHWSPLQIYWLIFDKAADVKHGTELAGIFSEDDSIKSTDLIRVDGATPYGFSYLSSQAAGYVKLTPVQTYDDGARIQTVLDVSGHKAAIRAIAEDKDGRCQSNTEACVGGEDCFNGGSFSPLGNIHVVQSMFGMPKEVRQQPVNGVTAGK